MTWLLSTLARASAWLRARPVALLVTAALLVFDRALLRGWAVWGRDLIFWVVPSRWTVRSALASGELPRWDHVQAIGAPLPANPLHGVFYPPTLLALIDPLPWSTSLYLWLHALLGALGVARLAARLGCSYAASATAGLVWSLAGPVASVWTTGLLLPAHAWAPWVVGAAWSLAEAPSARRAALAAVPVAASLLAGEPFMTLGSVGLALVTLPAAPRLPAVDRGYALRLAGYIALALGLAALVAGASLAPALAAVSGTQRAGSLTAEDALAFSVHPLRALDLVVPGGLRRAAEATRDPFAVARCQVDPLLFSLYIGATTVALALAGARRDRRTLALAGAAVLALLCAAGRFTPVWSVVTTLVPPFRLMRSPEKFVSVAMPAVALLAALGLDRVAREPRRAAWALAPALALALVVVALPRWAPGAVVSSLAGGAREAAPWLVALVVAAAVGARAPRAASWLIALCVVADVWIRGAPMHPWHSPRTYGWTPPIVPGIQRVVAPQRAPAPPRLLRARTIARHAEGMVEYPGGDARYIAALPPNLTSIYGIAGLPPYDVAVAYGLERFLWIRRVDVARVLSVDLTLQPARATPPPGLRVVARVGTGVDLLAVEDALPRVYAAGRAEAVPADVSMERALDREVVAGGTALVAAGAPPLDAPTGRAGACVLRAMRNGDIDAECALARDAEVVFVEQFAPGWRATVDGAEVPVHRANLLVMGVRAPAGRRAIALRYRPPGLRAGLALSAFGLVALVALARRRAVSAGAGS